MLDRAQAGGTRRMLQAFLSRSQGGGMRARMHGKIRHRPIPWERATQFAIIALAIVVTAGALRAFGDIAVPVVAALVVGLTLGPVADRLGRLGVPVVPMAVLLVAALMLGLAAVSVLISAPLASWIERAPEIGDTLQRRLQFLAGPLESVQRFQAILRASSGAKQALAVELAEPVGQTLVAALTPALGQILVFIGTLLFLLIGRERMRRGVVLAFVDRDARLTALKTITGIQQDLGRYFFTITLINAGLGALTALPPLRSVLPIRCSGARWSSRSTSSRSSVRSSPPSCWASPAW
jgi:predicted PurR-regulated permease PerM